MSNIIRALFEPAQEKRFNLKNPKDWMVYFSNLTKSGVNVTEDTALGMSAVWNAVWMISSSIASLPYIVQSVESDGNRVELPNHPVYKLIHSEPNRRDTAMTHWLRVVASALLWGNGIAIIYRNGNEVPTSLKWIHSKKVLDIVEIDDTAFYIIDGIRQPVNEANIYHLKNLDFDGLWAKSPISIHAENLGGFKAAENFGSDFFANDTSIGSVLKHPGTLSEKAHARLQKQIHGKKNFENMILEEGMEFEKLGMPLEDAQFIQYRRLGVDEVARIFNIPNHKIKSLERSTNNNIEQQAIEYVVDCLRPWIKSIEQESNRKLFSTREKPRVRSKMIVEGLLRGDRKTQLESYRTLIQLGVYNRNEVRKFDNLNTIEGGDKHYIQGAMVEINEDGSLNNQNNEGNKIPRE